jgi:hypothetical protein
MKISPEANRLKRKKQHLANKDKENAKAKEYRKNHPEVIKAYRDANREKIRIQQRNDGLKRHYGITLDEYNLMFAKQGWMCAICGKTRRDGTRPFNVDHDHATGKIRGILCHNCNLILGHANDDVLTLGGAILYIKYYKDISN